MSYDSLESHVIRHKNKIEYDIEFVSMLVLRGFTWFVTSRILMVWCNSRSFIWVEIHMKGTHVI